MWCNEREQPRRPSRPPGQSRMVGERSTRRRSVTRAGTSFSFCNRFIHIFSVMLGLTNQADNEQRASRGGMFQTMRGGRRTVDATARRRSVAWDSRISNTVHVCFEQRCVQSYTVNTVSTPDRSADCSTVQHGTAHSSADR